MIKDIRKLQIAGGVFGQPTSFDFFDPHDGGKIKTIKGSLVYGRNGTGKSTIAKAFRKIGGQSVPTTINVLPYDMDDKPMTISDEEKKHIFVFDENYIDENVKLKQDHLDTIVILGQAADLSEKIRAAEIARDTARDAFQTQQASYQEYCNIENIKSPRHYTMLLGNALRGDSNWAGRDKMIREGRQNTAVKDDTYKRFLHLTPTKPKPDLLVEFTQKMRALEAAKTGTSTIDRFVPSVPKEYLSFRDEEIRLLLSTEIEKPELSARERKLLSLIHQGMAQDISHRLATLKRADTIECPYCFQTITPEYKGSLVKSIEKVLNKMVADHQNALRNHVIKSITMDLTPFVQLNSFQVCTDLLIEIDVTVQKYNDLLNAKIKSPYSPITESEMNLRELFFKLRASLSTLEAERIAYNRKARATDHIIADLDRINGEIAYYDVVQLAAQLTKQEEEMAASEQLYNALKVAYYTKKKEVDDLEAQRKNIHLAVDSINACLQYIFFADDRLKIVFVDGEYKLLSHGKNVRPCDVSVGERNIIGLCYFFTGILEGKDETNAYQEEYLLVIDDPVSSYDVENRIGILSFIKYKLSEFLEGNQDTRALVLTHDLRAFYDIHKIFEEIIEVCKQKGYPNAPKFNRYEIRDSTLQPFSYKNRQEYSEILDIIYKYASGQGKEHELIIGNMMRQALEAFSTFEYKKGIDAISTDSQILCLLPDEKYVSYYKNLMYRLVLHGGSHKEEQIKTMSDFKFFSLISEAEKVRTAKDVLCFIYLLNKKHILEHLKNNRNAETDLQAWSDEIKRRAAAI